MPYRNIVFVKLEKRLLNDPRWYMLSEQSQLIYLKLMMLAAETYNRIPLNFDALRRAFKTDISPAEIEKSIKEIQASFPKFKQNKHVFYFINFESKTNYIKGREFLGKSRGTPKEATDKDKDKDKDKTKTKKKIKTESTAFGTAISDFQDMRKKIKKPLTDRATVLLMKKLEELAPGDEATQIKILEKSTFSSWQSVFPLKEDNNGSCKQRDAGSATNYGEPEIL